MATGYMDLYLLHWQGTVPFAETVECMEELKSQGLIRNWGVSNLDIREMRELVRVKNGANCLADQVLYHLGSRGVEHYLLPWLHGGSIPMMAYCPLAQAGRLRRGIMGSAAVISAAKAHDVTPSQVLHAFILSTDGTIYPIPRTGTPVHAR